MGRGRSLCHGGRLCWRQRQTLQENPARMSTPDLIRQRLAALEPETYTLEDESAQHRGHARAASGGGHFRLTLVSHKFRNLSTLARHRLVYEAMGGRGRRGGRAGAI